MSGQGPAGLLMALAQRGVHVVWAVLVPRAASDVVVLQVRGGEHRVRSAREVVASIPGVVSVRGVRAAPSFLLVQLECQQAPSDAETPGGDATRA